MSSLKDHFCLIPNAIENADAVFIELQKEVNWEERTIKIFGKTYLQPRLIAWQGEEAYKYSNGILSKAPFSKTVHLLKGSVEELANMKFNGVLLNMYRNGSDSMGWHSDNEKELGEAPLIAALSLGATRNLKVRNRLTKKSVIDIPLEHNSLLIMKSGFQELYEHSIPKSTKISTNRINLTFRKLI